MSQSQQWPEKMTKTRKEMSDLGLPGGRKKDGATVISNTITDQDRWTTNHELIFQLPDMPDNLAYSTWYREGSTEQQDEAPWENEDAECVLVRKVPKVVEVWTAETQPRIEVCRIDPDTLVGIAPCDDGEPGWVVMAVQPDPDAPTMEVIAPVGDEHGQIIYTDILDAAEVLKTGIVWKHDMGDGVVDLDEAVHAGPWDPMDGRLSYIGSFALRGQGERQSVTFWTSLEARHHVLVMAARHALSKLNSEGHRNVPMDEIDDTSWTFDPPATASPSPVLPSPAT